ncbi:hypothetical protein ASE63_00105 [Bosea sp. Root381]|jgi:hypothetical protein|uniref:hypothetical protein n=1 Tax=Bosea sp. Root381 TaxID=1736524 RepID=UPI0007147107|nr:hypothetical protein [Bosea sp. Root381]KRE17653.1 hypothetical protein ASE63_00105 [Bosea sp. Root381]
MSYRDELESVLEAEQAFRSRIALRLAEERGEPAGDAPSAAQMQAADEAIAAWVDEGEEEQDSRAFRPLTPLQTLLAEHRAICERILDIRDRRLS